jgi:hypothetical protein
MEERVPESKLTRRTAEVAPELCVAASIRLSFNHDDVSAAKTRSDVTRKLIE